MTYNYPICRSPTSFCPKVDRHQDITFCSGCEHYKGTMMCGFYSSLTDKIEYEECISCGYM